MRLCMCTNIITSILLPVTLILTYAGHGTMFWLSAIASLKHCSLLSTFEVSRHSCTTALRCGPADQLSPCSSSQLARSLHSPLLQRRSALRGQHLEQREEGAWHPPATTPCGNRKFNHDITSVYVDSCIYLTCTCTTCPCMTVYISIPC